MTAPGSREIFRPERMSAFPDGVFGVAITLLVIDLRLPSIRRMATIRLRCNSD